MRPGGGALLHGHEPVNITPAVFAATVLVGNTSTITPGTWTNTPVLTYTLRRDGVAVGGATGLTHAAAEAYVFVALDCGPALTWLEIATNASGSASQSSNTQTYSAVVANAAIMAAYFRTDVVTVVGGFATVWPDQSGNGRDLTQAGAGLAPAYGAASGPNGRPALTFDGVNDVMNTAAFALPQPCTVAWVGQQVTWGINLRLYGDPGTGAQATLVQDTLTPRVVLLAGIGPAAANTNLAVATDALVVALYNGAGSTLTVNATAATTGNPGAAGYITGFRWGQDGGNYSNTRISEVMLLSAAMTANQLASYRAYCTYYYGVP